MEEKVSHDTNGSVQLAIEIEEKLKKVLDPNDLDEIATLSADLADIKESCIKISGLVDEFANSLDKDSKAAADYLIDISTELDHISWHTKEGQKKIIPLSDTLRGE